MAAHVSLPASRSRPPIAKPSQKPHEIAAMDVAFALAIALEAFALEAVVVLGREGRDQHVIASAGRATPSRALARFAANMTVGEPVGAWRAFEQGRVHVEVIALSGIPCVVAVRGQVALDEPRVITAALQASFPLDGETSSDSTDDGSASEDEDDGFDFDLGWGDSPTEALRDVVG